MSVVQRHVNYRPDLDGLRAIAVLPVLFFHADLTWFPGGFTGVDVFFVLSGFFMAKTIIKDLESSTFSFQAFYLRRIRRIFPVLFSMILTCFVAAWFLFMPKEFQYFADSARAAALFSANVLFERESGYFDIAGEMKPLLHTWSLAIEEQFYILFPLALVTAYTHAKQYLRPILLVVLLVSFAGSCWAVFHSPEKAFYLLHFRIWELLIGALVALLPRPQRAPAFQTVLSTVGLAGILAGVFLYSRDTPFPGAAALLPCLSTALIIYAGAEKGSIGALLTNAPIVFIGRISYSLYVWRWPLIVFYRSALGQTFSMADSLAVLLLSFLCACLSYRFIEQPARYGQKSSSKSVIFGLGGSAVATIVCLGFLVVLFEGVPQRLPENVSRLYAATYDVGKFATAPCFADSDGKGLSPLDVRTGRLCRMGRQDGTEIRFLVWGDSHAAAIAPAIDKAARTHGLSGLFVGRGACPPLPETAFGPDAAVERCRDHTLAVMDLLHQHRFPYVFMAAYWPKYVHRSELPQQGVFFDRTAKPVVDDMSAPVRDGLEKTIAALGARGSKAILVMDVPEMGYDVPEALARARMDGASLEIAPPLAYTLNRQALAREVIEAAARKSGAWIADPFPAICDETRCHTMSGETVLYRDGDHLSSKGAEAIAPVFDPVFDAIKSGR